MNLSSAKRDQSDRCSKRSLIGVYFRGIAMGAADVVPGVSGGTVAFITGIYEELLGSIQSINLTALTTLFKAGPVAFWRHINGNFLLVLMLGIITSVISLASIISRLLSSHPLLVWSFFFGLIAASSIYMSRQLHNYRWRVLLAIAIGVLAALVVGAMKPSELSPEPLLVFLSGCLAICAMILPGVSGSFILVLLGMYAHILTAVKDLQWGLLLSFVVGCGIGLLGFSHLLSWLLKRFHDVTMALLTGFLIGSLNLVWPWKQTLSYYQNSKGESLALEQMNILPNTYAEIVGAPDTLFAIILMILGVFLVLGLEMFGEKSNTN
jgi:putative membrane protein